jgi:hypothetical protein
MMRINRRKGKEKRKREKGKVGVGVEVGGEAGEVEVVCSVAKFLCMCLSLVEGRMKGHAPSPILG